MWRSMDAYLRTIRAQPVRTIFTNFPKSRPTRQPNHHLHVRPPLTLSLAKTVTVRTRDSHAYSSSILNERTFNLDFSGSFVARCITSASSAEPHAVVDWNEAVSCSEVGDGANGNWEDAPRKSIPVRAYFFSTRFDFVVST